MIGCIDDRVIAEAKYIVERKATVRATAKAFGVSKSTIHRDVTRVLSGLNYSLFLKAKEIISQNKAERATRAGIASGKVKKQRKECINNG